MGRGPAVPGPSLANALADGGIATLDLISLDCSFPVIKGYVDCILARHRHHGFASPLSPRLSYHRLSRGLQRLVASVALSSPSTARWSRRFFATPRRRGPSCGIA